MSEENMLVSYIWDVKGINDDTLIPIGCVVATDVYDIGVSICNPKDTFNKKRAKIIAKGRAENHTMPNILYRRTNAGEKLESVINDAMYAMKVRAEKYFKKQ